MSLSVIRTNITSSSYPASPHRSSSQALRRRLARVPPDRLATRGERAVRCPRAARARPAAEAVGLRRRRALGGGRARQIGEIRRARLSRMRWAASAEAQGLLRPRGSRTSRGRTRSAAWNRARTSRIAATRYELSRRPFCQRKGAHRQLIKTSCSLFTLSHSLTLSLPPLAFLAGAGRDARGALHTSRACAPKRAQGARAGRVWSRPLPVRV